MNAVVKVGGKQYYVQENQEIFVEKLDAEVESVYTFDKVLLVGGNSVKVGAPYVEGATVTAKIVKHDKQAKVVVFRYHSKHNVRKKTGHRQPYTLVEIAAINA